MSTRALDHFRHNLRSLIEASGTIAKVCRDLDLNRQQMAKYLSGESLPSVPLLVKICAYFDVSTDIAHRPLTEVLIRSDDQLLDIMRQFTRGPIAVKAVDKKLSHPFRDGYYMYWQPSVWRINFVLKQLVQVKTVGAFQHLRYVPPSPMTQGQRSRSRQYSVALALGEDMQFLILTFFRRRGVSSWSAALFRESSYRSAPNFTGVSIASASWENSNQVSAARIVMEQLDMTGQSLLALARSSRMARPADVPQHVLKHLRYENGEFPDIISPF